MKGVEVTRSWQRKGNFKLCLKETDWIILTLAMPRIPLNFKSQNWEKISSYYQPSTFLVIIFVSTLRNAQLKTSISPKRREESKQRRKNEKSGGNGGVTAKKDPRSLKGWAFFTSKTISKILLPAYARKNINFLLGKKGYMFSVTVRRFWSSVYGSVELCASFYSHLSS